MSHADLATAIESAWEDRDQVTLATTGAVREAVETTLDLMDKGELRVAEQNARGDWTVNQWAKKAVLLSFRRNDMGPIPGGPGAAGWWAKVPSHFYGSR